MPSLHAKPPLHLESHSNIYGNRPHPAQIGSVMEPPSPRESWALISLLYSLVISCGRASSVADVVSTHSAYLPQSGRIVTSPLVAVPSLGPPMHMISTLEEQLGRPCQDFF